MELTINYIIAQIFAIIMYVFIGLTYYVKDRKKILEYSMFSLLSCGLQYVLLGAYTGLAMCQISILRNIFFMVTERRKNNNKVDEMFALIFLLFLMIILSIYTYNGDPMSLFSTTATLLFTISLWQKNNKVYRIMGIFVEVLWLLYNIYIKSAFAIILEVIMLIWVIKCALFSKESKDIIVEADLER